MICAFQSLPILNFPFPKFTLERFDSETVNRLYVPFSLCRFSTFLFQNLSSNGLILKQSTCYYVMICAFQSLLILNFPFPKYILERFDSETVFSLCRFSTFRFQNISANGLPPKQSIDYYVMIFALRSVLLFCLYVLN